MVRKIRFPLEMANGVMVRTLQELKENFDLEKIIIHYKSGKLLTWLNDRYYENEAKQVEKLIVESINIYEDLCNIFEVNYCKELTVNIAFAQERNKRLTKLKQFTDDDEIIKNIDKVAFNQEELGDLLDYEEKKIIYLCDNNFNIPVRVEGVTYIGISNVIVKINLPNLNVLREKGIKFINVVVENNGKVIEIDKLNKREWEVFTKKQYFFDPNIEYSYENEDGKVYNLEVTSLFVRDKTTGEERMITEERECVYKYITYENILFYAVGEYKKRKIFMRKLDNYKNVHLVDCKKELDNILCVDDEFIIWKDNDSNYYSVNYNSTIQKEIYNSRQHRNSLIHDEVLINKYFLFIDKDNFLYTRNLITNKLNFIFDRVKMIRKYNDNIYIVRSTEDTFGKENFYKFDVNTNKSEFICSTKQMRYGTVVNIEFYDNNIIWVNSGLYKHTLNIINLETYVLKELDEWHGCGSSGLSSLKIRDGYIYYDNLSIISTYDRINRKIKLDGSCKEEVKKCRA